MEKQDYKKYPFPILLLILYLVFSIAAILITDTVGNVFLRMDGGFIKKLIYFAICLVLWIVELIAFYYPIHLCSGKKVFRGKGFYAILTLCQVLSVIGFIAVNIIIIRMELPRPFFGFLILILDAAFPFVYAITVKLSNKKCSNCGVLNSYKLTDKKTDDLGVKHKFHNEGGYTRTVKTSIGIVVQDVPTTAVYDGEFSTIKVTRTYNCLACGAIRVNSEKIETKV